MIKSPPLLPHCHPGFTLIELITVMLIIGIMAFVVVPRLDLLRGFDEIGYRNKVKATLEYARKSAVAMRREVRISVNGSGLTVEFQTQTPELEGAAWSAPNLPGSNTSRIEQRAVEPCIGAKSKQVCQWRGSGAESAQ